MKKINKVAHLTSVHARYDTRIFIKQCKSLAKNGYDVSLIVADGKGDEVVDTVKIYDVGFTKGRIQRMVISARRVYKKAKALNCDVYHFHDPELIPVGLKLKKDGKKVIYDVHEDLPRQIMSKHYLPVFVRKPLAIVLEKYENHASKKIKTVITATPFIKDRFAKIGATVEIIHNFPLSEEFETAEEILWEEKKNQVCYIGGITRTRGIVELIKAVNEMDVKLIIAGKYQPETLKDELIQLHEWDNSKIEDKGFLDRKGVNTILRNAKIGIVALHPVQNYLDALPVKMFEYMAAGIPFVASDFPYWRKIVEECECGICVDPLNYKEIADGIKKLLDDPETSAKMGVSGKKAIAEKYNWYKEEEKLLESYRKLLSDTVFT